MRTRFVHFLRARIFKISICTALLIQPVLVTPSAGSSSSLGCISKLCPCHCFQSVLAPLATQNISLGITPLPSLLWQMLSKYSPLPRIGSLFPSVFGLPLSLCAARRVSHDYPISGNKHARTSHKSSCKTHAAFLHIEAMQTCKAEKDPFHSPELTSACSGSNSSCRSHTKWPG